MRKTCHAVAVLISCAMLSFAGCSRPDETGLLSLSELELAPADRVLVLAPHPDDEVLGCGGILRRAVAMKLPLRIVFLTYGDNGEWSFMLYRKHPVVVPTAVQAMGLLRRDEALAAARLLGVDSGQLIFLGYPDGRTFNIWCAHWADEPPAESALTHVKKVPYANAFREGASYKGEEIVRDLQRIFREFRPTKVFVSHPGDEHPDHAALYLFTRIALWNLEGTTAPEVFPYVVHCRNWPKPRGYHPEATLSPPEALRERASWRSHRLEAGEIDRKHAALRKHLSQYEANTAYLLSFVRPNELFGDFPAVALRREVSSEPLSLEHETDPVDIPEELIDEERASFVGIVERSVRVADGCLVLTTSLSRPLGDTVGVSVYAFGYRRDVPFAEMPKLHVRFGALRQGVYDQGHRLRESAVELSRTPTRLEMRIPLRTLGNPERVLTSARTTLGALPLDWASWQTLEMPR